jgi:alkylation response protein AidB-like acyl-CoA dehydrogenase
VSRQLQAAAGEVAARLDACQRLVYAADKDPDAGRPPGVAKIAAAALAREAGRWAVRSLSLAALVDHPLLEKWTRDAGEFQRVARLSGSGALYGELLSAVTAAGCPVPVRTYGQLCRDVRYVRAAVL